MDQRAADRALGLLRAACPELTPEALAVLSIGERDAHLLTLREWTFGPTLRAFAACPACREPLDLVFQTADVRLPAAKTETNLPLTAGAYELRLRPPNCGDLAGLPAEAGTNEIRDLLLDRCLMDVRRDGEAVSPQSLPGDIVDAALERLASADPQADIGLAMSCPSCAHTWREHFDITSFFWAELNAWACRLIREVHALAAAYGWCEGEILQLSPRRRQFYLSLAGT